MRSEGHTYLASLLVGHQGIVLEFLVLDDVYWDDGQLRPVRRVNWVFDVPWAVDVDVNLGRPGMLVCGLVVAKYG